MNEERHLWACALAVQQHGEGAMDLVNSRRAGLAMAGDQVGCNRWEAIAARLDALSPRPAGASVQ